MNRNSQGKESSLALAKGVCRKKVFSVKLCGALCLCGEITSKAFTTEHRGYPETDFPTDSLMRGAIESFYRLTVRARLGGRHPFHRDWQFAICAIGQGDELTIGTNGFEHGVDARFHHLLLSYGMITFVLEEVTA